MESATRLVRARWVVTVSGDVIENGWVRCNTSRVLEIGRGRPEGSHEDLGDAAILPQLVNAHTHLEFSTLVQPLGTPGIRLADWIGLAIQARQQEPNRDQSLEKGLALSVEAGVSLIGEITTPPCRYPTADISVACFAEVLGLSEERGADRWDAMSEQVAIDPWCGISPHAPYSTSLDLVQRCVRFSAKTGRALAMHVAESPEERELLEAGTGAFAQALAKLGLRAELWFPWGPGPFRELLSILSGASRCLLVHGNDFRDDELDQMSPHSHLSVVYCPRTHFFFQHAQHPVASMLERGIRVALGTDSLASNPDLSVWGEAQYLLNHRQDLSPNCVLQMATMNGADALGYPRLGRIEVGCAPRLGWVPSGAKTMAELYRDLAQNPFRRLQ